MALLARNFNKFFRNKKIYFGGVIRDILSKRDSRSVNNDDDFEDELEKQHRKSHISDTKF